jgi:hypothetical protein
MYMKNGGGYCDIDYQNGDNDATLVTKTTTN